MQVRPGVHLVEGTRGGRVYLLADGNGLTLVDSGVLGNVGPVLRAIRRLGAQPSDLRTILITHGHPDHTGTAARLRRMTGARLLVHEADAAGQPEHNLHVHHCAVPSVARWLFRVPLDGVLRDGQVLPVLGGLRVLHAPGHTPGSAAFYLEQEGVLFTGDTLLANGRAFRRPLTFPGANHEQYRCSLERLAQVEFATACPGHGQPIPQGGSEALAALLESYPAGSPWWHMLRRLLAGRVTW